MSAAPRYPSNLGYTGLSMTADQYLALRETPERYELIDGVVVMSPSAAGDHNEVLVAIVAQLYAYASASRAARVFAETDIRFADDKVYRPDISLYRRERLPGRVKHLSQLPDLIVEVLSPATALLDLNKKREDYERFGVGEYWIADPETGEVRAWRRTGDRFTEQQITGDSLESALFPGLSLDLHPIRAIARGEG